MVLMQISRSAGGVVVGGGGSILLVSQNGDSWSLPKGIVEKGESPLEAARREIREESGLRDLTFVRELGTYERCRIGKGGVGEDCSVIKHITLFLFRTYETVLAPEDEHNPEARFVDAKNVAALLTHQRDREFFESIRGTLLS